MKERIVVDGAVIEYELKRRTGNQRRQSSIRLTMHPEKGLVVTVPKRVQKESVERFIVEKKDWIQRVTERFQKLPPAKRLTKEEIDRYKKQAHALAVSRLAYFAHFYGFMYGTVRIKDQKTRWGSCSSKGNLNFNYRIALLPKELAEYIIVHELCHRGQMNHSQKFWKLVEKTVPTHRALRKELRQHYPLGSL